MVTSYETILTSLPQGYRWAYLLLLFYTLYVIGAALENKAGLLRLEILRWLLVATALTAGATKLPGVLAWWSAMYLVISGLLMVFAICISRPSATVVPIEGQNL